MDFYTCNLSGRRMDEYFKGWVEYHLECARTRRDPVGDFHRREDGANPVKHMDAAEDMLKYLYPRRKK